MLLYILSFFIYIIVLYTLSFYIHYCLYYINHDNNYYIKNTPMRCVCVSFASLLSMMAALGNDVQGLVVGDDGICYILLLDEMLPQTKEVLRQYGCVTMDLSDGNCDRLVGNTPMNLRRAIQMGALRRPSDAHQDVWKQVCDRAGIVEESRAQTMVKALQYIAALALFGRGKQTV